MEDSQENGVVTCLFGDKKCLNPCGAKAIKLNPCGAKAITLNPCGAKTITLPSQLLDPGFPNHLLKMFWH